MPFLFPNLLWFLFLCNSTQNLLSKQPRHTYLSLLLASLRSLKDNDLNDEAKFMLAEAAKDRSVVLEM